MGFAINRILYALQCISAAEAAQTAPKFSSLSALFIDASTSRQSVVAHGDNDGWEAFAPIIRRQRRQTSSTAGGETVENSKPVISVTSPIFELTLDTDWLETIKKSMIRGVRAVFGALFHRTS